MLLGSDARKVLWTAQAHRTQQVVNNRLGLQEGSCSHVHVQCQASMGGAQRLLVPQPDLHVSVTCHINDEKVTGYCQRIILKSIVTWQNILMQSFTC